MIGCERLCGKCEACFPLTRALGACSPHGLGLDWAEALLEPDCVTCQARRKAIEAVKSPSALAELLGRALRGRVPASGPVTWSVRVFWSGDIGHVEVTSERGASFGVAHASRGWTMADMRTALARVLATDTAEAAIAALEAR